MIYFMGVKYIIGFSRLLVTVRGRRSISTAASNVLDDSDFQSSLDAIYTVSAFLEKKLNSK